MMPATGKFHAKTAEAALKELGSDWSGLDDAEAGRRLEKYGRNEIPERKKESPVILFLKQFNSVLIYVLMAAAAISFFFGHMIDVYVIVAVIIINASMGFVQEYRAGKAIDALKRMVVPFAKVYRNGELAQINAAELVQGDLIFLEEGDRVPADARLLESKNLRAVEASLTGESFPSDKEPRPLPENTGLADMRNMVWLGTFIASGRARAVVASTGEATALGSIASDIRKMVRGRGDFEKKTGKLALQMGALALITSLAIFVFGFFLRGFEFKELLLFTIASLVSGIPEGLPAVLVVVLAIGAHNLARKNAIIRRLPAIDAIGAVTTIVTDKTGTLTLNMMTVKRILASGEKEFRVGGSGWEPEGDFRQNGSALAPLGHAVLGRLMRIAAVCNSAKLVRKDGRYTIIGDPTEGALLVLAAKAGLGREAALAEDRLVDELSFSSELRFRASLVENKGKRFIYAAGAPEALLERSTSIMHRGKPVPLGKAEKEASVQGLESIAKNGMRAIALCYCEAPKETFSLSEKSVEGLVFAGMVGMADPPRPEVKDAVAKAKKAGIRVIMATGDHKITAVAIAKEIGIVDGNGGALAMTGEELMALPEEKFGKAVARISVFARLTPRAKLRIAEALQKQGHIVAMTGDGVNDAPALRRADVGISMGISGTDVARESSEIVLADDNFASIVNAVEEGRVVFRNVRQTSYFLITTNFAEGGLILSTLALGFPLPLLPTQILWLNLVTAGVSDVALATEKGHNDVLDEPPRKQGAGIISRNHIFLLAMVACIMVVAALGVFWHFLQDGIDKARTGAFLMIAFCELFNLLNMRSLKKSLFEIGPFSNRYIVLSLIASIALVVMALYLGFFQEVFRFAGISFYEFLGIAAISSSVFWAGEIYKRMAAKPAGA